MMKKKIIALTLAASMIFSMTSTAFAANDISKEASALNQLGLLTGDGSGVTSEYLAKPMDRITAAIMVLKMQGKYEAALAYGGTSNFVDANTLGWSDGKNILAYLKANPSLGFSGNDLGKFEPYNPIAEDQLLKVMLENLDYKQTTPTQPGDFTWSGVKPFAKTKGLTVLNTPSLNVGQLAVITDSTLRADTKYSGNSLIETLVAAGKFDEALVVELGYIEEDVSNLPLEVKSVTIPNLKQVLVVFSKPVDRMVAEKVSNYTITLPNSYSGLTITKAQLQEDKKSVLLTISSTFVNGASGIDVSVLKSVGLANTYTTKVKASDSTVPSITDIEIISPREFELIFSEPVKITGSGFMTLNGVSSSVSTFSVVNDNRIKVTTKSNMSLGSQTLSFVSTDAKNIKDYAGYTFIPLPYTFDYAPDNREITAEVTGVTSTAKDLEVIIQFNKPITLNSLEFRRDYDKSDEKFRGKYSKISSTEYKVIFEGLTPPGNTTIFLTNKDKKNLAKDAYGNTLADTSVVATVVADNVKPEVLSVMYKTTNRIEVTFSERLDPKTARAISSYTLYDPTGKKVAIKGVEYADSSANNTLILVTDVAFGIGTYTLDIKNIRDVSMFANIMDPVSIPFVCKDETAPKVGSATRATDRMLKVVFSKPMHASAGDMSNWLVTGSKLESVEMQSDNRTVFLHVENANRVTSLKSILLKDTAGNSLVSGDAGFVSGFDVTITLGVQSGITPKSASLVEPDRIEILVEGEAMSGADYDSFTVYNGSTKLSIGMVDENMNEKGDTIISIYLGSPISQSSGRSLKVSLNSNAYITNEYDAKLNFSSLIVLDKCGPSIVKAGSKIDGYYSESGALKTIKLMFSEQLYIASVNDEDFEVSGYVVESVSVSNNTVYITVKDTEYKFEYGDSVTVSVIGSIADQDKNESTGDSSNMSLELTK